MKQLIVNGDDFGLSPGVTHSILEAHHNGIVTSTTVMVNFPDAAVGLEQALTSAPDLGLGLHFNLTAGRPVSAPDTIPSLVNNDGAFYYISAWPEKFATFDPDHIRREIEAQVQRFISLAGQAPDHLDAHHHAVYMYPAGLQAMLEIAERYTIPMRNGQLELPTTVALKILKSWFPTMPTDFAEGLIEQLKIVAGDGSTPFWPARVELGFFRERATLGDLLAILTTLPENSITELMCHPGYRLDAQPHNPLQLGAEVEHLTHAATLECIQAEGIQLITFGNLTR